MRKRNNVNLNKLIFYISYCLFLVNSMFNCVYFMQGILVPITYIAMILLMIKILFDFQTMDKKNIFIIILLLVIAFITKIVTDNNLILNLTLLVVSFKKMDFEKLVKFDFIVKLLFVILIVILYKLGLTEIYYFSRNGSIRQSMGFSNPNFFSNYVLMITIDFVYLRRKKINLFYFIIPIISIFIINYYAESRTQIIALILIIILLLFNKMNLFNKENRIIKFIVCNIFAWMLILSMTVINLYKNNNTFIKNADIVFSRRLGLMAEAYDVYGVHLLGTKVSSNSRSNDPNLNVIQVDNAYIFYLLSYGPIINLLFYYFFYKLFEYTYKEKNGVVRIIMFILLITAFSSRLSFLYYVNVFLLYFSKLVYKDEKLIERGVVCE